MTPPDAAPHSQIESCCGLAAPPTPHASAEQSVGWQGARRMNGGAREVMNDGTRLSISAGQHEEQKWKSRLTFLERMG